MQGGDMAVVEVEMGGLQPHQVHREFPACNTMRRCRFEGMAKVEAESAAEIQAALQHHTSSESIPGVPELRQWIQRQIYGLVLKYRESLQPDIDRSDPLE